MPSPEPDLQAFLDQHWRLALWVARRRVRRSDGTLDAVDAESDAVLGLWRAARTWNPDRASSATWVRYKVERAITDGIRDRARHNPPQWPIPIDDVELAGPAADTDAIRKVDVARAIARLEHRQRLAVVARYRDGLSWRAIGEQLGISESGAHHLATAARRRLQLALDGWTEERPHPAILRWWGRFSRSRGYCRQEESPPANSSGSHEISNTARIAANAPVTA